MTRTPTTERRGGPRATLLGMMVLLAVGPSGCAPPQQDRTDDGRVIVQYWEKWTGFEGEAMQGVVDRFNASQNEIVVKKLTISQIDQKLMLSTAGGNPPDVAGIWTHAIPDFSEKGALTPLDQMAAEAGITRDDYIPVFWDLCRHRGFLWALPTTPASTALHYNRRLFREAGLDPDAPPQSLAELDRMAEQLTIVSLLRDGQPVQVRYPDLTEQEKAAIEFKIVQMGHLPQEPGWWMATWPYWFGGRLWDGDRTITAESPGVIAAFEWFEGYARKYGVENLRSFGASFGNFSSPQNPFLSERVAMELQGEWMYNFIDKFAPHMEWDVAPFPAQHPDKKGFVTLIESDVLVIPKGARHPREAFAFIRYVQSQAAMEQLNLGQKKFSPLSHVSPTFVAEHPNPHIATFIQLAQSANACYMPRLSIWSEYKDEMQAAIDQTLALDTEPRVALAAVQKRLQRRLDRIMRRWDLVREKRVKEWSNYDTWGTTQPANGTRLR